MKKHVVMSVQIRRLRETKQWSRETLAETIGTSPAYIAQLESGFRKPGITTLMNLAHAFDLTIDALLKGETADKAA